MGFKPSPKNILILQVEKNIKNFVSSHEFFPRVDANLLFELEFWRPGIGEYVERPATVDIDFFVVPSVLSELYIAQC
jgi:hypothetical protein